MAGNCLFLMRDPYVWITTMKSKKTRLILLVIAVLGLGAFLLWKKLTGIDQPVLDNTYYPAELDTIRDLRKALAKDPVGYRKLKAMFVRNISEKVFPYWYGTKWDFNGTTETPQQGSIACGYFVTTTLRDMGLRIDRVKLAQCASEEMITTLVSKEHIHRYSGLAFADFCKNLEQLGKGLYIIGLDNHTGYVLLSEEGSYFIHSSGWFPFRVVKQNLAEADAVSRSKYRIVGKISDDEAFLKRWVSGNSR